MISVKPHVPVAVTALQRARRDLIIVDSLLRRLIIQLSKVGHCVALMHMTF